jgi:hypothetical protein
MIFLRVAIGLASCVAIACSSPDEPLSPDVANVVVVRGTVVTANGQPAVGAVVHTEGFRPDCTTQVHVERDTMLVADATGSVHGFVYAEPGVHPACLKIWARQGQGGIATQLLQVEFRLGDDGGRNIDTASVDLTLPDDGD